MSQKEIIRLIDITRTYKVGTELVRALRSVSLSIFKNEFVTMINIHYLKGGYIFLYLIENCLTIPFLGVITEFGSEELDDKIKEAINKRNLQQIYPICKIIERTDPINIYTS